ncbi:concanavalin A-like lectin/glucanase [Stipitochalara longipes BDJ]|nr:concanavalin A-like lectin/glucanase [Stipitochalara longipes BDJ]
MRFTAIISTAIFSAAIFAAPQPRFRQRSNLSANAADANEQTDDWAGAVVKSPPPDEGGFVAVIGTFTVPSAMEDDDTPSAVSIWVGIDGYTNNIPVVQAGVDAILDSDGDVTYRAWAEWNPNPAIYLDDSELEIVAGDSIQVHIATKAGDTSATALFTNLSNGNPATVPLSTSDASQAALGQNMEWMVERIHGGPDAPPTAALMNFGTITMTNCYGSTAARAGSVNPPQGVGVDMLNSEGGVAATAAINGNTVTVTWQTA